MSTQNKRTVMTLYSGNTDIYSHQVRIVLAEKGVTVDILQMQAKQHCEDLATINPYNSLPTLVDRDLVLYEPTIIMEYLDERFPHPPLLPVYPVARAKSRLMMHRIHRDWYTLLHDAEGGDAPKAKFARKTLIDSLISLAPVFADSPYFLSEEFTLVDCCMGPLLWRLLSDKVKIPMRAKAIQKYASRVFERPSFQASLSEDEIEIRT
jgi:RNA polymerase-associated protein